MNSNYNKWFLTKVKQAIADFGMIEQGDKVAVGLSGGKDSIFLLFVLSLLAQFSHLKFELGAIHIEPGWSSNEDFLRKFCRGLNIPYFEEKTEIAEIVFHRRNEKNPCSLCSSLRRGALVRSAKKLGFQKIALGHHGDDAVETLLLNSMLGGKLESFSPVIFYPDTGIAIIRPLIYLRERTVVSAVRRENLPFQSNPCPIDKKTKRQEMKEFLADMEKRIPRSGDSLITALKSQWLKQVQNFDASS